MSELGEHGATQFGMPAMQSEGSPEDALLAAIRDTAAPDFEVLGEIARNAQDGAVLYLARAVLDAGLVALRLTETAEGEFQLELIRQLNPSLPSPGGSCSRCGAQFLAWARYCSKCGSALFGDAPRESPHAREELRQAVEEAAAGRYEILGEMKHSDGPGVVYFARDFATGRIEALRVQPEGEEEYSIGKTNVMRRLSVSITATRPPQPPSAPPAPKPAPAPPPRPAAPSPPRPAAPAPPSPAPRPPARPAPEPEAPPARPAPARSPRRSIHIPVPDFKVPDLPPVVWALAAILVVVILLFLLF